MHTLNILIKHQNRNIAMNVLKSRILAKKIEDSNRVRLGLTVGTLESTTTTQWGSQIRSVVLNPYIMVKDHRTMLTQGNVDAYLKGSFVTEFMEEHMIHHSGKSS